MPPIFTPSSMVITDFVFPAEDITALLSSGFIVGNDRISQSIPRVESIYETSSAVFNILPEEIIVKLLPLFVMTAFPNVNFAAELPCTLPRG